MKWVIHNVPWLSIPQNMTSMKMMYTDNCHDYLIIQYIIGKSSYLSSKYCHWRKHLPVLAHIHLHWLIEKLEYFILGMLCMESLSLTSFLSLNSCSINFTTTRGTNGGMLQSGDKLRLKVSDKLSMHNLPIIITLLH